MPDEATRVVYDGRVVRLELDRGRWEVVRHAPAVAVLALSAGRMLVVRQHRHPLGIDTLEAPAGLIDDGEAPLEAAARELAEECQLAADLKELLGFHTSPGFTDEHVTLFLAENLRLAEGTPDDDEDVQVEWIEPAALLARLRDGSVRSSGPTVAAALLALLEAQSPPAVKPALLP